MSADESGACSVAEEEGVQEWVEWYFRKGDASQWACGHCHVGPPLSRWPTRVIGRVRCTWRGIGRIGSRERNAGEKGLLRCCRLWRRHLDIGRNQYLLHGFAYLHELRCAGVGVILQLTSLRPCTAAPGYFRNLAIARIMNSSKRGTVKAMSP